jgi:hypothetical protein
MAASLMDVSEDYSVLGPGGKVGAEAGQGWRYHDTA